MTEHPTLEDVQAARERIRGLAFETPLKSSYRLGEAVGRPVALKLETTQPTGAFKLRGAANAVLRLSPEQRRRGVVTMSSGNHGQALAYVAQRLEVPAVICVSEQVPASKVEGIRRRGAEVRVIGRDQDEATAHALELARQRGLTYVSPFDDPAVIAGQGTIGLEILEQDPETDTLVVPLSGGGLMAGIAVAARALRPEIRLYGVSQALGPAMHDSLAAGRIVPVIEEPSLADALQGGMPPDNRHTFALCRRHVDQVVLLSEAEIARAMVFAFEEERLVLEGGGAIGLGALLEGKLEGRLGERVAVVVSGDNVAPSKLLALATADNPQLA